MQNYIDGTSAEKFEIATSTKSIMEEEAREKLKNYSSVSDFDDDRWIIDKINQDKNVDNASRTIHFATIINKNCQTEVKIWAIMLLMKRRAVRAVDTAVEKISIFYQNIKREVNSFEEVANSEILLFYKKLFENSSNTLRYNRKIWFSIKNFLSDMKFTNTLKVMNLLIVPEDEEIIKNDNKYIPEEVAIKLDLIMKKEVIPVPYRTIYWILRLIPNRIAEACSMTINCLKQIDEDTYILSIPTFKQTGSYHKGSVKLIEIKYDGIGKYLIDLIKQQIEFTNGLEIENKTNFLFYSNKYEYIIKKGENNFSLLKYDTIILLQLEHINRFLERTIKYNNITDDEGNLAHVTSHMFRHNAITDRLTSGIFRPIEVMGLTAHHNTAMIEKSYSHFTADDLRLEAKAIKFNGRIINTDNPRLAEQILKKPFAYSIYGLGICSDVRGCDKNKSECYRCPYMIPDFDNLDRYKMEQEEWRKKKSLAEKTGNTDFADLCDYWVESYQIIIQRILKALSDEDIDIETKEEKVNEKPTK